MSFLHTIRDWWRGYTDADIASLGLKMANGAKPGGVIRLTAGEWAAFQAGHSHPPTYFSMRPDWQCHIDREGQ